MTYSYDDRLEYSVDIKDNGFVNRQYTKFICGNDVKPYIDGIYLEEIAMINYEEVVNRVPYYGYDSQLFDFIFEGRKIVSGQVLVNVHTPQFLYKFLNELGYGYDSGGDNRSTGVLNDNGSGDSFYDQIKTAYIYNNQIMFNKKFNDYVLPKFFDIDLYIDNLYTDGTFVVKVKNIALTGYSVRVVNDDNLYEVYTFLARDTESYFVNNNPIGG